MIQEKVNGNWRIQLNIDCPYCEGYFNILESMYIEGLPHVGSSETNLELEIECPICKSSLLLDSTTH